MIIVKLWGGLCNQMFQYAFGIAMAKKTNDQVKFDVDFFLKQPGYVDVRSLEICEVFSLSNFTIIERPKGVDFFQNRIISNLVRRLNYFHCTLPGSVEYIKEKTHVYSDNVPYFEGKINYYDGYWQTAKYFDAESIKIRECFSFDVFVLEKVNNWLKSYEKYNTVALHIRRRDMVGRNVGYNEAKIKKYYLDSIKYFIDNVEHPVFIVFSDDIEWCKELLASRKENIVYQDNKWSGIEDLAGISLCKNGIMSQSTFSWWGNWLGDSKLRIVVAPKGKYLNDQFIPKRWVRI